MSEANTDQLNQLEEMLNNNPCFEIRRSKICDGLGMFAIGDIEAESPIMIEKPFVNLGLLAVPELMQEIHRASLAGNDSIPGMSAELCKTFVLLCTESNRFAEECKDAKNFDEKFPPARRKCVDAMFEICASRKFEQLPADVRKKWMSLHDCFQIIPLDRPSRVAVCGLTSEAGQKLNGLVGTATFDKESSRFKVVFGANTAPRKIKRENLKTPGGVFRTNSHGECGMALFEKRARMNHSCRSNTVDRRLPVEDKIIVLASRDIKKGEEITSCYSCPGATEERRAFLRHKYNFECDCPACEANETIDFEVYN